MHSPWRMLLVFVLVSGIAAAAGWGASARTRSAASASSSTFAQQLLECWRKDPERYARLIRDWRSYRSLPREQQERLLLLDHDLHEQDSATQARLWRVLDRYNAWLEQLLPEQRQQIEALVDPQERMLRIKELRTEEWLARLPTKLRERIAQTSVGQSRDELIAQLRQQEQQRKLFLRQSMWRDDRWYALGHPRSIGEFPGEVQGYIRLSLLPILNNRDRNYLRSREGHWPGFVRTLVKLADSYTIPLLPGKKPLPRNYKDLPADMRPRSGMLKSLTATQRSSLQEARGKSPQFALAVVEVYKAKGWPLSKQLGPCKLQDFSAAVQEFVRVRLQPLLSEQEKQQLSKSAGHWPEYPRALMELAQKHQLLLPGMSLPGPKWFWDMVRSGLPELPDRVLRDFALYVLTAEERSQLKLSFANPSSRFQLTRAFFARYPEELQRLQQHDAERQQKK